MGVADMTVLPEECLTEMEKGDQEKLPPFSVPMTPTALSHVKITAVSEVFSR